MVIVQSIGRNSQNEILCDEIARANKINANLDIILGPKCILVLISSCVVPNTNDFLFLPIRENQIYSVFVVSWRILFGLEGRWDCCHRLSGEENVSIFLLRRVKRIRLSRFRFMSRAKICLAAFFSIFIFGLLMWTHGLSIQHINSSPLHIKFPSTHASNTSVGHLSTLKNTVEDLWFVYILSRGKRLRRAD